MARTPLGARFAFPVLLITAAGLALCGCGGARITMDYPPEALDFSQGVSRTPIVAVGQVTDMRPLEQRNGQGHFAGITFPKDEAWERPATEIYGEALAQDLDQTHLVELVPFQGQADYVLSADLLSLGCRMQRSASTFLIPLTIGAGLGMVLGEDTSGKLSRGALATVLAMGAIPMPTRVRAECEVRMTLTDREGTVVWRDTCYGEYEGRKHMAAAARQDQELVDQYLTKAVKRANACLLGQLRQAMLEDAES